MSRRMIRRIAGALFTVVALVRPTPSGAAGGAQKPSAPPVAPTADRLKMPGADLQTLMLGTRAIRVKCAPGPGMPQGGIAEGREVWRSAPGYAEVKRQAVFSKEAPTGA